MDPLLFKRQPRSMAKAKAEKLGSWSSGGVGTAQAPSGSGLGVGARADESFSGLSESVENVD